MENGTPKERMAFIWDLDGTLLDSYGVIVSSLYQTCREFGIETDPDEIMREVITHTVGDFIQIMEERSGIPFEPLKQRYSAINDQGKLEIKPIKNAPEVLSFLKDQGCQNLVFTHRGTSTDIILKHTGLFDFFDEIITGKDGFPRKPDPAAIIYLVQTHGLDRDHTYYVGDRTLDIECADNAGIRSILYLPDGSVTQPTGRETFIVNDLLEIRKLFG